MKVIVTGATGMIGRPLCRALIARGHGVVVFSRNPDAARARIPGALDYVRWQPSDASLWTGVLEAADAVVHLAGESLFEKKMDWAGVERVNNDKVVSTRTFVEAMRRASRRPRVFVNASSQGFYGFERVSDEIITEDAPAGGDRWGRGNLMWEEAARPAEDLGVRVVWLRTGVLLGREGGPIQQALEQFKRGWGGYARPGNQWFSWIHEDDEVGLILMALEDERVRGPLNLTAPHPMHTRDYAEALGRIIGQPVRVGMPGFALGLIMGAPAEIITRGRRVVPKRALELGYRFSFPDLEPALRDIVTAMEANTVRP